MAGIFVSYRREDLSGYAGRLADDLTHHFPGLRIFRDVDSIAAGTDFRHAIHAAIHSSSVCLVLIGARWLSTLGANGRPRLYEPWDFVRIEIASALARQMVVIPILIDCSMPRVDHLPDDVKALAARQAHELSDKRWDYDVDRLCEVLSRTLPGWPAPSAQPASKHGSSALRWTLLGSAMGAVGLFIVLAILGLADEGGHSPHAGLASAEPLAASAAPGAEQTPPRRVSLTPAMIAACVAECDHLVDECVRPCQGGNACAFCGAEGEKCKQLCPYGSCNPACSYNGRCQGLSVGDDPRDCCPPNDLNDRNDCAKLLAR